MKEFWMRLNAGERRLAVGGLSLLFLILNYVFVWPHFFDWNKLQHSLQKANQDVATMSALIAQKPALEIKEKTLKDEGADVPQEDQAFQFARTIQSESARSGVRIVNQGNTRQGTGTNQFFLEQTQTITVQSDEKQLVDFLYGLGAGTSLVRVRALSVQPDQSHQMLNSQITLVASYQKAAGRITAPAPKPAAAPAAAPTAAPSRPSTPAPANPKPATPPPGIPRPPTPQKP